MTAAQPTIIATSIGFHGSAANPGDITAGPAYAHAARLARAGASPRLCIIGTALGDNPAYLTSFYAAFGRLGMNVTHLALFPMPNVADPEDLLMSQDVIFVGGGSVANMVAVWRVHRIDEILRKAWQAGIVLAGSSAGGICWFEGGTTDSFGIKLRAFTDGLAMLPGSFCPHYHSEAERRPLYQRLVADGALPGGIACDDGTAAHFTDETLAEQVSDRPEANAYLVTENGAGGATETPLPVRFLGA